MPPAPGTPAAALKCPVCSASFRGNPLCPRCGSDLQGLMRLAARAWALRNRSRAALRQEDLTAALSYSADAWKIDRRGLAPFGSRPAV